MILSKLVREVEMLQEYDIEKHIQSIKDGDYDLFENEYEIVKGHLGLPIPFMQLDELEQKMVLFYIDSDYIEPYSGKNTKNDKFISFLASYDNQSLVKNLFYEVQVHDGWSKNGDELFVTQIKPNPQYAVQRMRLKALATSIWSKANLKEIVLGMRDVVENDGYRDDELLERKILDDALGSERDSFTLQNRKMAMDIKGMKRPQAFQNINLYLEGGGKQANRVIIEESGNSAYDILPPSDDEWVLI